MSYSDMWYTVVIFRCELCVVCLNLKGLFLNNIVGLLRCKYLITTTHRYVSLNSNLFTVQCFYYETIHIKLNNNILGHTNAKKYYSKQRFVQFVIINRQPN